MLLIFKPCKELNYNSYLAHNSVSSANEDNCVVAAKSFFQFDLRKYQPNNWCVSLCNAAESQLDDHVATL